MTKEELVGKLKMLYETGKSDHNAELYDDLRLDQDALINEMAENIIKSKINGV